MQALLPYRKYYITTLKAALMVVMGAFWLPAKLSAQAPTISYASPHIFTTNVAGSLTPTSSNVAPPGYGSPVVLGSGLTLSQNGMALDAAGSMYIADFNGSGIVVKISADGSSTTTIATGFSNQSANVALDRAGNVFVTDQSAVWKIPASGSPVSYGTPVAINNSFTQPFAVAVDTSGNIYVADFSAGGVYKMDNTGANKSRIDNGLAKVAGLAVDAAENVYATDVNTEALYEIPANGNPQVQLATGFTFPRGLAVDAVGTAYIDDEGVSSIYTVPAGGGTPAVLVSGLSNLVGLAIDGNYNLYGALQSSGGVNKFSPQGGYFINTALPPGLTFSGQTGVISGTPTAVSAAADYTITAHNAAASAAATVNITVAPPPVISYATPQTYTTGTAITPLSPSSTGATVTTPAYSSALTTLSSNFSSPTGVARDAAGNLYVADKGNNNIIKFPVGGGAPVTITASLNSPAGVALDASGNIYVADNQNGLVKKISADLSTVTTVGSGFIAPINVAFDPTGNLFIADAAFGSGSGTVYEIEKATGKQSIFAGGFDDLSGLATDARGNVYVTDKSAGALYKYTYRSNLSLTYAGSFIFPTGVTVDASGNIFVTDALAPQVYEIPGGNGAPVPVGTGYSFPENVVTDGSGNVYVTDEGANALYELSPTGGYYVNQPLPHGLKLNDTTGIISGTPKVVSGATNYTVTAYASGAIGSTTVNLTVNAAQPPVVSYGSPQSYTAGTAITALIPTNTGGPVASISYSDNLVVTGSGFSKPAGTAVDSHGNIYVADNLNNLVMKIPAGNGTPVSIGGSFSAPAAVAVDSTGNVYVADEGNAQVVEIPSGGGSNIVLGSGITAPNGIAVDPSGNVFVTDESNQTVYEIPAGNTTTNVVTSGFSLLTGIAADASGNLYIADGGSSSVYKLPISGGIPFAIGSFFDYPTGVAVDATGNVYVADQGPNVVYRIPGGGFSQYTIISELNNPEGIVVDGYGNLYIADTDNDAVETLAPAGGYFVNKTLPTGLTFSTEKGKISGTATATAAATDYVISAYNTGGVSRAKVNITVTLPPPPTISYTTPLAFGQGATISPVSPAATNVASPAYPGTSTSIGNSFSFPYATATDASGNVYIADAGNNAIYEVLAGGPQITLASGLNGPVGVAVDKSGNVYVTNQGDETVVKIAAHTGTQTLIGSGYQGPSAVAVDSAGNVFVADLRLAGAVIYKIPPGHTKRLFQSGFSYPDGIAIDAAGDVYVSDEGSGGPAAVYVISPDGSTKTTLSHHFFAPTGIAFDATGNLFISDGGKGEIVEYPAGGSSHISFSAGITAPFSLSADGVGNLYVADVISGKVFQVKPTGGYFINRRLPAGLNFNATTGIISGTPTMASVATDYIVSGYNIGSGAQATVNIAVLSNNASLASMGPQFGPMSPVFNTGITSYALSLPNSKATMTVKPVTSDPNATVAVNGTPVASGSASAPVPLAEGATTTINVVVTAQDGVTTQTYAIAVTRGPSSNADLLSMGPAKGPLSPVFNSGVTNYTETVANTITSFTVTPVTVDPNATITVNGNPVSSGSTSDPVSLDVNVPASITVVVTAQDGTTSKTYTIAVTRPESGNATLVNLGPQFAPMSPVFAPGTTSYSLALPNSKQSMTLTPVTAEPNATITVNGTPVASGSTSAPVILPEGQTTTITVVVTAQNGATNTYTVAVTRAPSTNADLTAIGPQYGPLSPTFKTGGTSYTLSVPYSKASMAVTPVTADANATITVNGNPVTSGTACNQVSLTPGTPTNITVVVTAQDGTTTKTYTIAITRGLPTDAILASMGPQFGPLSPVFYPTVTSYTLSVPNSKSTMTVTPAADDALATVTVNGTAIASGSTSDPVALTAGATTNIDVVVTAEDGTTTKTYTIAVSRAAGSSDSYQDISVSKPTETVTLAKDGIKVHQGISPNGDGMDDVLQIDNISQYPDNHLKIMNRNGELVYDAKGYDNTSKTFDGHSNKTGKMQLPGTYFFQLDYTVNGATKTKTGYLVLKY